jgi:starch phosphorylase
MQARKWARGLRLESRRSPQSFLDNLLFVQGRSLERATVNDLYMALAHTVRDRLVERWTSTMQNYQAQDVRVVCYLSAEFLTGPHLANNLSSPCGNWALTSMF